MPVWEMAFNEESIIKLGAFYTDDLPPMKFAQQMTMEEKVKLLTTLFTVARELELDGITSIGLLGTEPVDDDHVKDGWGRILRVSEEGEATAVGGPVSAPPGPQGPRRSTIPSPPTSSCSWPRRATWAPTSPRCWCSPGPSARAGASWAAWRSSSTIT